MTVRTVLAAAALLAATSPSWAADVGVSVQISQPGVYGRVDIGRFPQPAVIVPQPVVVAPPPPPVVVGRPVVVAPVQPVYMWVPPGHRKHWHKHCHEYGACGVPVYFVRHDWYNQNVRVAHDGRRGDDHRGKGHGHGKGRGKHDD